MHRSARRINDALSDVVWWGLDKVRELLHIRGVSKDGQDTRRFQVLTSLSDRRLGRSKPGGNLFIRLGSNLSLKGKFPRQIATPLANQLTAAG
jgi:hypothetical protein